MNVIKTKTVNVVNVGSNIVCVSCGKDVFMLSHEKCVARYALSRDSRVKRALFTSLVAAKSKNLGATFVVAKLRSSVAKIPTTINKVASALSLSPNSCQSRTLSNYMKNKIATSRKWQKWFEYHQYFKWTPKSKTAQSLPSESKSSTSVRSKSKTLVTTQKWVAKLSTLASAFVSSNAGDPARPLDCSWEQSTSGMIISLQSLDMEIMFKAISRYVMYTTLRALDTIYFWLDNFVMEMEVAFRSNTCYVRNLEGVDLLTGSRDLNLYTISIYELAASSLMCLMSKATSTKSWLWKKQESFPPKLVPSTGSQLELLHMNLCGPMRVEEPVAIELNTLVLKENVDELVQEDVAELDRNVFYNPPQTPVFEEAESSSTYQDPSNMHE
ncbi:hypothetical protein Tco_0071434 [Tanacetum coccineum]